VIGTHRIFKRAKVGEPMRDKIVKCNQRLRSRYRQIKIIR